MIHMIHLGLYYPNLAGRFILFPLRARAALHVSEPTCHGKQKTVARQTRFPWCKCGSTLTNEMQRKEWEHITNITKKLLFVFFMFFQLCWLLQIFLPTVPKGTHGQQNSVWHMESSKPGRGLNLESLVQTSTKPIFKRPKRGFNSFCWFPDPNCSTFLPSG